VRERCLSPLALPLCLRSGVWLLLPLLSTKCQNELAYASTFPLSSACRERALSPLKREGGVMRTTENLAVPVLHLSLPTVELPWRTID